MVGNDISASAASVGLSVSGREAVSATQPASAPVTAKGLAIDGARHLADAGDGAHRRHVAHRAIDRALDLVGDEVAAVGAGADRQRLGFQIAQGAGLAAAHVGVEGRLVLEGRGGGAVAGAGQMRPGRLQRELVDDALVLVERAIDAVDLLGGDDIGGHASLDLGEALVIAVLEGLERAHEAVEGGGQII